MTEYGSKESKFENKMIPNLNCLILPEKAEYKKINKQIPYHQFKAAEYRDTNYPEFIEKEIGANAIISYFPADLREDGSVYDLVLDEKDEELSFLFETQPNLAKLGILNVDQSLMLKHCPEKAQEKYFLMPETFAFYTEKFEDGTFDISYRLLPSLEMLPADRSLRHTVKCQKHLEMVAKMYFIDSSKARFSLTPDVLEYIKSQESLLDTDSVLGAINELKNGMHTRFDSLEDTLLNEVINKMPESKEFVSAAYSDVGLEQYLESNKEVLKALKKLNKKTKNVEKTVKLTFGRVLKDELPISINLEGGVENKKGTYIVSNNVKKPFTAEIMINPKIKTKIKNIESTLPISNAWYCGEEKEFKEAKVYIKEKLIPGELYTINLEFVKPEQITSLILETNCKAKMNDEYYPIKHITQTLPVEVGNVGKIKAGKAIKKFFKLSARFAAPMISNRVKALVGDL